jgi:glucokinase
VAYAAAARLPELSRGILGAGRVGRADAAGRATLVHDQLILAGDIGGTNTRLAWFEVVDGALEPGAARTYGSQRYAGLAEIVLAFLQEAPGRLRRACFGIAGPVRNGRVEATNLPWVVDAQGLAGRLGLDEVLLVNDLEANAWGLAALSDIDFAVLQPGDPAPTGNAAVISAGTGLGEAGLVWDGRRHRPIASEAGHADWAPQDDLQLSLWRFLAGEVGHVSVERVLSGPGLHNIYRFFRDAQGLTEPDWLTQALRGEAPAPVISEAGLQGRAEICVRALDLFVAIYGAEAGNLGLRMLATAGVYLGGGIAPRILPALRGRTFLDAFAAKGRLRSLLEAVPVRVVLNDQAALVGAARRAALEGGLLA